ncbi:OB-fold domain-containing protein [Pseudomonas sp. TCU-HL1]|uniref:OB-fold domain-containing protein n=1 Tax=Pseudomonas sp. TCU-HL1 TaxID=1856685 RepID=UPI0008564FD9|nr:OB-fold domain-containing protein [Pseudomonas sp. TCU-HL1]AOE86788.1 3-hydroxy-3-methylglutaryl CoA synthase [Pseudomonas sp. TCU-HL1]
MNIGITGYGAYIPRLRLSRQAVVAANAWYAPELKAKGKGHRTMANWDEDSITMAVAAARDALGGQDGQGRVRELLLASCSLPFAERLNAAVVAEALNLDEFAAASDVTGSQCAALAGLSQALASAASASGNVLLTAADNRKTRAASAQELDYGDGAAALLIGREGVIAEVLGQAALNVDFIDHFRQYGRDIDYYGEERWIRDEGVSRIVPKVIERALKESGVAAETVDHFIFPTSLGKAQVAIACGLRADSVVDELAEQVGHTGVGHGLLMLAQVLEHAEPGQLILLAQFGSGARAFVLRVTEEIRRFKPRCGVAGWLERGREETSYTRYLAYKGQLQLERGVRGEQDKKTALSTAYRHRRAILGLVAGRCRVSGDVHFPPSRFSYTPDAPQLDSQEPYPLADRPGRVLSWSAESLSSYMAPPHHYGQIDFEGGGRVLMEFTDVARGDVETGMSVEMVFRIKDIDELRGFKRYFWKATPVLNPSDAVEE